MPTAFVTGAAGFLGRHLSQRLVAEGWEVTAFCRIGDPVELLPKDVRVCLGDLADPVGLARVVPTGVSAVFHLAGNTSTWSKHAAQQWLDNVQGTRHVVAAALLRDAGRLIVTSSTSAFGRHPNTVINERTASNAPDTREGYARSKFAAEQVVWREIVNHGLSGVVLNPVNILGAGDRANWSRQLILPIAQGTLRVVPPGAASWIAVEDVVSAHLAAAQIPTPRPQYILGGVEASFAEVATTIGGLLGRPVPNVPTSARRLWMLAAMSTVSGAVTHSEPALSFSKYRRAVGRLRVDDRLARHDLGLKQTPLVDQLANTIAGLRSAGLLPELGAQDVHVSDQLPTDAGADR